MAEVLQRMGRHGRAPPSPLVPPFRLTASMTREASPMDNSSTVLRAPEPPGPDGDIGHVALGA